jgi:hypothetical protein
MKKFYIKRRDNPQLEKPYYIAEGQLSKTEANRKGRAIYGSNEMLPFDTVEQYEAELARLRSEGFHVHPA